METSLFSYDLPPELIATHPAQRRDGSRLMMVNRATGAITHHVFSELSQLLSPDDLLVLNNSRVIPASLFSTDGKTEVLLIEETSPGHWTALANPAKLLPAGARVKFAPGDQSGPPIEAEVLKTLPSGERVLRFYGPLDLERFGAMPLPPYIRKRRRELATAHPSLPSASPPNLDNAFNPSAPAQAGAAPQGKIATDFTALDQERYQTVYAHAPGSVAAPTAGLHFTPELLAKLPHAFVTLHVGVGTFRPVKVENIQDHVMHEERFEIPAGLAEHAAASKRIVAVGTTAARVLESVHDLSPQRGRTRIFIHPPYKFKRVGALLTNFHLPRSTLLMLVCAFGRTDLILRAYHEAVQQRYRFYSYGDAMLVV